MEKEVSQGKVKSLIYLFYITADNSKEHQVKQKKDDFTAFHACNWGSTPHGDANNKNEGLCS